MMRILRAAALAAVLVVAMQLQSTPVSAGPQWCEEDPEFVVNGNLVDVTTWFDGQYASRVSAVHFDMQVPSNVVAAALALPGTVPVTASISRTATPWLGGPIPVTVTVTMRTSASFSHTTSVAGTYGALVSFAPGWSTSMTKVKFKFLLP